MIYVVAGNYQEFKEWLSSTRLKYKTENSVKFVTGLDIERGLNQNLVLLVGKYWGHPHINIISELESTGDIYFVRPKCEEEDV
jgi:hypothetical protein